MLVRTPLHPSSLTPRMVALGVGTCLLLSSVPTLAAPAAGEDEADQEAIDTEARAMKAYRDGQEAYDAGDYSEALQLFLDAQSLYPSPDFHYNIGKCHEALESYEQAAVSYKAYLRAYRAAYNDDPADKANIENKIDRLEKQVEADKAAAEAAANKEPEVIIRTVPGEDKPKPPGRALIITGGVLTGVGVGVVIAGAAVFGTQAANISGQLDDVYENGNPERVTLEDARVLDSDGRAAELNQVLLISIGSAVAVTGVALLAVGLVKKKKGPTITPAIGPEGAGLVIRGRF
jgi:tetratricopeptide (TPR) repeat protein